MMKAKFTFSKMISYWNKDEGAGVKVNGEKDMASWHSDASWLNTTLPIDNIEDVQNKLKMVVEEGLIPNAYYWIVENGLSFSVLEDGAGSALDDKELDELYKKGEQVYLCDYTVFIEIQQVYNPTFEQLKQMFPRVDY